MIKIFKIYFLFEIKNLKMLHIKTHVKQDPIYICKFNFITFCSDPYQEATGSFLKQQSYTNTTPSVLSRLQDLPHALPTTILSEDCQSHGAFFLPRRPGHKFLPKNIVSKQVDRGSQDVLDVPLRNLGAPHPTPP